MSELASPSWTDYLKQGLSARPPGDPIAPGTHSADTQGTVRRLLPFFRRRRREAAAGLLLVAFTSALGLPQPLINRYIVDTVILGNRLRLLIGAVALLAVVSVAEKLLHSLQRFYFARLEQKLVLDIQQELLRHSLRLPMSFFDRNETGYLMSRLSADIQGLRTFFSGNVIAIPTNALRFAGGLGVLFYLEWRLALSVVVIAPVFLLSVSWFSSRLHSLSHRSMEQQASINGRVQESLSAIALIKAFSSEGGTLRRLMSELKSALHISLEQQAVDSSANFVIETLPGIARTAVLGLGAWWVIEGRWTLGSLLAFQAYLGYVFGPAQYLASANLQLQSARAALERIAGLLQVVPEENVGTGRLVRRLAGRVEFRGVSFAYEGGTPVLNDISFRVEPGEHVAIVGPSGAGKTTLLNLILRFYRPTAGEIYVDDRPVSEYEVSSLRDRIGHVAQSSLIVSGTILQNLCYGNPDASEDDVRRAAKAASIHRVIERLPDGYNSVLGGKGNLSEGQRQRLSIARALVKDPDILVFDEPTSALDSPCERSIFKSLPRMIRRKTLFIVTHRVATIRDCDRILLLDKHRIVAAGTHRSLLASSAYYRSMFYPAQAASSLVQ